MSLKNLLAEKVILPASDILTGQSIACKLAWLRKSQFWSRDEIHAFQTKRLRKLLRQASDRVPYYRDLFTGLGFEPDDLKSSADLSSLPLLQKKTIKLQGVERFNAAGFPPSKTVKRSSSGSTGEPLFYLTGKDAYSLNLAVHLRGWYWMGYRLGDRYVKLSQNQRKNSVKRMQDIFSNNLYLSINPLLDSNFDRILDQIERFRPKIIRCYPDPMLYLARYRRNKTKYRFVPDAINTTGNTLFPEARREIEEAFGCPVFDAYGTEGAATIFECPKHGCYHAADEYGISEVLDELGNPIERGIGRLIATDLWNFVHPFIRYDTQDLVEIDDNPCGCGRKLKRIVRILGRDNEVLEMKNGRKFIVHNFTGFFHNDEPELKRAIDRFQVVNKGNQVVFNLQVNNRFDQDVLLFVKKYWEKEMQIEVAVEVLEQIPLTASGKRRFILNETKHGQVRNTSCSEIVNNKETPAGAREKANGG